MGRGATMYCSDCKVSMDAGYGSCGTWLDGCRTVEEFDSAVAREPHLGTIEKNIKVRAFLVAHAGHDLGAVSANWSYQEKGRTYLDGPYGAKTDTPIIGNADDGWEAQP